MEECCPPPPPKLGAPEEPEPRPFFLFLKREPPDPPVDPPVVPVDPPEPAGEPPEPAEDPAEAPVEEEPPLRARKACAASVLASWESEASSRSR